MLESTMNHLTRDLFKCLLVLSFYRHEYCRNQELEAIELYTRLAEDNLMNLPQPLEINFTDFACS